MHWEWDENKSRANRRKHGLSFETARLVFGDPAAVSFPDPSAEEERWRTVGMVGNAVVMVVHTEPDLRDGVEAGRIISARKATRRERKNYEEEGF
ncbi:MAG: BrnT family toxin [Alphaproteobacteria bacterium]|nr:BrnT family toxin [Alphaproteobacteria bacterium]